MCTALRTFPKLALVGNIHEIDLMRYKVKRKVNNNEIFYAYFLKNLYLNKYIIIIGILIIILTPIVIMITTLLLGEIQIGVAISIIVFPFLIFVIGLSIILHSTLGVGYWYNRRRRWHKGMKDYQIYILDDHLEIIYDWDDYFYNVFKTHHYYKNIIKFDNIKEITNCLEGIDSEFLFRLKYYIKIPKNGFVFLPGKRLDNVYKITLFHQVPFYNFLILYDYRENLKKGHFDVIYVELDDYGKNKIMKAIKSNSLNIPD